MLKRSVGGRVRCGTLFACALGSALFLAGMTSAQDQPLTIRIDVPLVAVNVEVSDSYGRPVSGLRSEDFLVYEDGQLQSVQTFGSSDAPYSLILIFDCSESTSNEFSLLNDAVSRFSEYRRPSDRVLIAAFGSETQVIRNWNEKKNRKLARDLGVCFGTNFYDAVRWTIDRMRTVKGRRGVVMLTDGADSSTPRRSVVIDGRRVEQFIDFGRDREFQKALRAMEKSGISYYFVAVKTDLNPGFDIPEDQTNLVLPDLRQMRLRMEEMASVSGGSVVYPTRPADVLPLYQQLAQRLGSTYSLGYVSTNSALDGRSRRIEVRVQRKDVTVRQWRHSYTPRGERNE